MSDTSDAASHLPIYQFGAADELRLPQGCELVGVEITDDAVELPSFRHPLRAAYVFGSERLSLSEPVLARCRHVVKIPTRFSINVGMAGAIVMYDRMLTLGRFGERPLRAGGPAAAAIPARAAWGRPSCVGAARRPNEQASNSRPNHALNSCEADPEACDAFQILCVSAPVPVGRLLYRLGPGRRGEARSAGQFFANGTFIRSAPARTASVTRCPSPSR